MAWSLHLGPINIWCEFAEDPLKILFCRVYTRKMKLAPQSWPQISLMGGDNVLGSRPWPMNIWYELEEDWLKTLPCKVHTVKTEVAPLVAQMSLRPALFD